MTLGWQNVASWTLQQNNNLILRVNWSASSGVTLLNGTNYLILTPTTGDWFFRLANP